MSRTTIRRKILISVIAVVVLAVCGSVYSLIQVSRFQKELSQMNEVAIPIARLAMQLKNDSEIYLRESERRLSMNHWQQPGWRPQRVARWLEDVIDHECARLLEVTRNADPKWVEWSQEVSRGFDSARKQAELLHGLLTDGKTGEAADVYSKWSRTLEEWSRRIKTGATDAEHGIRKGFFATQSQTQDLRTGLQAVLMVVVVFSFILFWMGERALRPVQTLTELAKNIRVRGTFNKSDKQLMAALDPGRTDEISQFAREFHRLATTLIERERTVEQQQAKLQDQNHLLRRMLDEQKELQKKLQLAEHLAAVGRMSAQVAHEVRNPLHSMGLEAELALEQASNPTQREAIESIMKGIGRLEQMTENYLKLSRLSAGQKHPVDCAALLSRVLETYRSQSERQKVDVLWRNEADRPCLVYGDPDVLEQALGNLMRNALQSLDKMSGIKQVEWSMGHAESGRVWIRVHDTGVGIAPEHHAKVFTPFFTTKAQGTGLGLSFVKKVLENHGGDIQFMSKGNAGGATFEIVLPAVLPEESRYVENTASR